MFTKPLASFTLADLMREYAALVLTAEDRALLLELAAR